jgi:hypothetical protein
MYTYVGNNPASFVDPWGYSSTSHYWGNFTQVTHGILFCGPWDAAQIAAHGKDAFLWSDNTSTMVIALAGVDETIKEKQRKDITNALRHAFWAASLYRNERQEDAGQALLIHEYVYPGGIGSIDQLADMWNNNLGRKIGLGSADISSEILRAYYEGQLQSNTGGGGFLKPLKPLGQDASSENKCKK